MTDLTKLLPTLSSNVQNCFAKYEAMLAAIAKRDASEATEEDPTNKAWTYAERNVTRLINQRKALIQNFTDEDNRDWKILRDEMHAIEAADKKSIEKAAPAPAKNLNDSLHQPNQKDTDMKNAPQSTAVSYVNVRDGKLELYGISNSMTLEREAPVLVSNDVNEIAAYIKEHGMKASGVSASSSLGHSDEYGFAGKYDAEELFNAALELAEKEDEDVKTYKIAQLKQAAGTTRGTHRREGARFFIIYTSASGKTTTTAARFATAEEAEREAIKNIRKNVREGDDPRIRAVEVKKFATLENALAAASDKERENHENAKLYNSRDYAHKMKGTVGRAKEILVIDGMIFYTFDLPGSEKGMTLLNRVETLGSVMHDAPFYRVHLTDAVVDEFNPYPHVLSVDTIGGDFSEASTKKAFPYSRSMDARRVYARRGWTMTTEFSVVKAYLDATATAAVVEGGAS